MYEVIEEGKARIRVRKVKKISKEMGVFYNPIMRHNRDISILLLNCIDKRNMQIALPLAGTGVRGIRFLLELNKNKIENISFNDNSKDAIKSIKNNLPLSIGKDSMKIKPITIKPLLKDKINNENPKFSSIQKVEYKDKIRIYNEDANLFLLSSTGFDYIDADPFGSPNFLLDSAVKRISREGILAVTATDTAALTGTYLKVCRRKYWAEPLKNELMHETGLRILIRKIQLVGGQYEKALIPIFSYFKDHYFRIFFRCVKGKKDVDEVIRQHGMFGNAGSLWLGRLWDEKLANKMYASIIKKPISKNSLKDKKINYDKELIRFIKIIKDESKIDAIGFHDIHRLVKRYKIKKIIKKEELIRKIKRKGHGVSETHFSGTGIRSNILLKDLIKLLKR